MRKYLLSFRQKLCQVKTTVHLVQCLINLVEFGKFRVRQHIEYQPFWISIGHFLVSFNYKLQNIQWSDEYSAHKINTDNLLICELYGTVKLYGAEFSLSEADWHSFPNNSPCSFFNVCITNWEQIARNFRITNENKAADLSRIGVTLIPKSICARVWKLSIKKAKNDLKTMFRPLFDVANKTRGRTADVRWLWVHCVYCAKGKKGKDNLRITFFMNYRN
jgi:hypothetical protein